MGVSHTFVKSVINFFNFVIMIIGLAVLALGICAQFEIVDMKALEVFIKHIPLYIIVVGSIILLITIFGCWGACGENTAALGIYSVGMALLMAAAVMLAIVVFLKIDFIQRLLEQILTDFFKPSNKIFSTIESYLHCCGTYGYTSYEAIAPVLPETCCAAPPCSIHKPSYPGCIGVVKNGSATACYAIAGIATGLATIELLQVLLSSYLAYSIRKKVYKREYYEN